MRSLPAWVVPALIVSLLAPSSDVSAQTTEGAPPDGAILLESTEPAFPCVPEEPSAFTPSASGSVPARAVSTVGPESLYSWPLGNALHDGLVLVNYVDDDRALGVIHDYMGNRHSYDGHGGTDITLLNFRQMDRGMPILAAADGVVLTVQDGYTDRNAAANSLPANFVYLDHGNGTRSLYYHLRRGSTAVRVGETVRRGQLIGLAGSSGNSTDAHLHFETYASYVRRDPWSGTYNTLPSLWRDQEPYVEDVPVRFYDMGIFTADAVGGTIGGLTLRRLKDRISQPVTFGRAEGLLGFWVQLQGRVGVSYRIDIRRPDGTPRFTVSYVGVPTFLYAWQSWYWYLAGIPDSELGTWKATLTVDGTVARTLEFKVGPQTIYAPRFWPVAGRSFQLDGRTYQDPLGVDPLSGTVTYSLLNAPPYVSLDESAVVTINTPARSRERSTYFQAIATNEFGLCDTMWYHLVDLRAPPWVAEARAFVKDRHRTVAAAVPDARVSPEAAPLCVQVEPVNGSYTVTDVDLASVRMMSSGTGITDAIDAVAGKHAVVEDADGNGVTELAARFALNDLARLFSAVTGRHSCPVTIEADLITGGRLRAEFELTVVGGGPSLAAAVEPNPSNRQSRLTFETRRAGSIKVMVFDLSGRLVRRLVDDRAAPAGRHSVSLDRLETGGGALVSGLYFYRIETAEGTAAGRFAWVK